MKVLVFLTTFLIKVTEMASSNYFDIPWDVQVTPVYRRFRDDYSGQTFQLRIQAVDPAYQNHKKTGVGSVYYDPSYLDWSINPFINNIKRSVEHLGASVSFIENPIFSDDDDIFASIFYRRPAERDTEVWKFGPFTYNNGLQYVGS